MNDIIFLMLSLSLSGTVIAGLCFAVKAIWKKKLLKSVLYYLWLIALVRLALPFSFNGALLNRIYEGNKQAAGSTVSAVQTKQVASFTVSTVVESNPVQMAKTVSTPVTVSANTSAAGPVDAPVMTATNIIPAKPFDFTSLITYLWLAGFTVFSAYTLVSYSVFAAKLKKANRTVDENVLEIGKQLGCKVQIYQNSLAKTPMLIGFFRQSIILPDVIYTNEELKGALTHELTHKRRHDLLYKWFVLFVNAVHWFNPVIWLVRREVNHACELSCDEAVIKNLQADEKQTYGETLINLAAAHRYPAGIVTTTLCKEKQTLKERLGAIMSYEKKGLWNKVISCVLIAAIAASGAFLGACGTKEVSSALFPARQTLDYPEVLNILAPTFFWDGIDENAETPKQQWQDEMSERYGVKFNVVSNTYTDGTLDASAGNQQDGILKGDEKFPGLAQVSTIAEIQTAIDYDVAVPLDDYLADNPIWNALPDEIKSTYKINGHIYAIPTHVNNYFDSRVIYKDTLEQTGINVTDLDSLKKFALAYTKLSGNYAISSWGLNDLSDILNAFGLYNGEGINNAISYDPTEDCMVDFLTKGAAVDALEYLRELYTAGALYCDFDGYRQAYDNFNNHKSASFYYLYDDYSDLDNYSQVITLNTQYPQILDSKVSGFYMTKDAPQPKETINFFVNMLFGSEQNYLECWLGSSDNYTLNSDGSITIKKIKNSNGSFTAPAMPNLTGGLTEVFPYSDAIILYSQNGVVTGTKAGEKSKNYEVLNDALEKGIVVKIPPTYSIISTAYYVNQGDAYYTNQGNISALCERCIEDALTKTDYTVQQIIDQYRADMLAMGGNAILDEMNASIGKKTAYYYG